MSQDANIITVGLTPRHNCPAESYIWPEEVENVFDFQGHLETANKWLTMNVTFDDGKVRELDTRVHEVRLYLTGLTALTVAFLNAWAQQHQACGKTCRLTLLLMHWDNVAKQYVGQRWQP